MMFKKQKQKLTYEALVVQVTASNDFNLKVWDTKTQQEKWKLQGHTSSVQAMAYKVSV